MKLAFLQHLGKVEPNNGNKLINGQEIKLNVKALIEN